MTPRSLALPLTLTLLALIVPVGCTDPGTDGNGAATQPTNGTPADDATSGTTPEDVPNPTSFETADELVAHLRTILALPTPDLEAFVDLCELEDDFDGWQQSWIDTCYEYYIPRVEMYNAAMTRFNQQMLANPEYIWPYGPLSDVVLPGDPTSSGRPMPEDRATALSSSPDGSDTATLYLVRVEDVGWRVSGLSWYERYDGQFDPDKLDLMTAHYANTGDLIDRLIVKMHEGQFQNAREMYSAFTRDVKLLAAANVARINAEKEGLPQD